MRSIPPAVRVLLLVLACLTPALAFANGLPSSSKPKPRSLASARGLRLAMPDASPTVDPALAANDENVQLANLLYAGLVRLDSSYRVAPASAARYNLSRNKRVYTFYLKKGLRFSNGDAVTASDFRFAITRSLSRALKSPSAPVYLLDIQGASAFLRGKAKSVTGVKVVNRYTLKITTRWAVPYFLMELTYPTSFALDEKRIRRLGGPDNTAWYAKPIGSGPYRFKSWSSGSKIVLLPNKYFTGQRPALKNVTISLAPLPETGLYQYFQHNVDVATLPTYQRRLRRQSGVHETKTLAINGLYMNLRHKPFSLKAVRRALALALNRSKLVSSTMRGTATAFAGFVPPGQSGYDPRLKALGHEPVAARRALKSAGYGRHKRFPSLTLYYPDDATIGRLARSIARSWRGTLKLSVDTKALTLNTLLAKVQAHSLKLYLLGWSADYPDAHDWLSSQWESNALNNDVGYRSKRFDQLAESADASWSYSRRMHLYDAAQQQLVSDVAWIPLYIPHRLVYVRPGVTNLAVTGYGLIPRSGSWAEVQIHPPSSKKRRGTRRHFKSLAS